jgi:hypothetical protein
MELWSARIGRTTGVRTAAHIPRVERVRGRTAAAVAVFVKIVIGGSPSLARVRAAAAGAVVSACRLSGPQSEPQAIYGGTGQRLSGGLAGPSATALPH